MVLVPEGPQLSGVRGIISVKLSFCSPKQQEMSALMLFRIGGGKR